MKRSNARGPALPAWNTTSAVGNVFRLAGLCLPTRLVASAFAFVAVWSPPSCAQQSHENEKPMLATVDEAQTGGTFAPADTSFLQSLLHPSQARVARRYNVNVVPYTADSPSGVLQNNSITPACNSPHASYFNGPVVSNVQVVPVLWGSHVNTQIAANIAQFYSDATISNWYDMLSEYASVGGTNQSIGRGTSISAITITPSRCASTTSCNITDAQLQTEIASQIQNGILPSPQLDSTGNTVTAYMMYFPPNIHLSGPGGAGNSCVNGGFCAYHNTGTFGSGGTPLPYGAVMDTFTGACSMGCGGDATALQNATSVSSHELAELVSDADIGLDTQNAYAFPAAWGDNNNQCGEIADICDTGAPGSTITVSGRTWTVQQLWSNGLAACLGSGLSPNYVVSAPSTTPVSTVFAFTVTAKNPAGNKGTDIAYVGTVHFTSSDPGAVLPPDFTYGIGAQGTAGFSATLNSTGSQTITATDTLNGNIVGTSGPITVTSRASQTIAFANPGAQIYGSSLTLTATASSMLPVSFTSTTTGVCTVTSAGALALVSVGSCTIDADQSGNGAWLAAPQVAQTFQVTAAPLTIAADNQSRVYAATDPSFTWTPSGFVNADTATVLSGAPALSSNDTPTSPVGAYAISIAAGTLSAANYTFDFVNGTLTITQASSTATLSSPCMQTFVEQQPFTMNVAVTAMNATGHVLFDDGHGGTLCNVTLGSGISTCTTSALAVSGSAAESIYSLTANYSGDGNYQPSSSNALTVNVLSAADVVFRNGFETETLSCPSE